MNGQKTKQLPIVQKKLMFKSNFLLHSITNVSELPATLVWAPRCTLPHLFKI
jgi:hypothetical protein